MDCGDERKQDGCRRESGGKQRALGGSGKLQQDSLVRRLAPLRLLRSRGRFLSDLRARNHDRSVSIVSNVDDFLHDVIS